MSEFSGTLCSSMISGGSKEFTFTAVSGGYAFYSTTIYTYKCSGALCSSNFNYTIHVTIRNRTTGAVVYSTDWVVPVNISGKTQHVMYGDIPFQYGASYVMTWSVDPVDSIGGCMGIGCIACADIYMIILWPGQPIPSPSPSPTPTPSPGPSPGPWCPPNSICLPQSTCWQVGFCAGPCQPSGTEYCCCVISPPSPTPTPVPTPTPTPTPTPPPTPTPSPSPSPSPTTAPSPPTVIPWWGWALIGASTVASLAAVAVAIAAATKTK